MEVSGRLTATSASAVVAHHDAALQLMTRVLPEYDPMKVSVRQWQAAALLAVCRCTPTKPWGRYKVALQRVWAALREAEASAVACYGRDASCTKALREHSAKFRAALGPEGADDFPRAS